MNSQHRVQETEAGMRLDQFLATQEEITSRGHAQRLLKSGNVLLDGKAELSPSRRICAGQKIFVTFSPPEVVDILAEAGNLDVLHEDPHLLVINKAAGVVVHPSAGHSSGTLVNFLLHHCNNGRPNFRLSGIGGVLRPGIVHRLDKDTSGVLVVAKTDAAHQHLAAQFEKHSVKRQYQAVVWGNPEKESGVVDAPLARHPLRRKEIAVVQKASLTGNDGRGKKKASLTGKRALQGKRAVTHWRVLRRFEFAALLACRLETGRTHQIRVHLTSIGHPLIGDPQYGKPPPKARFKRLSGISSEPYEELRQALKIFRHQCLHAELLGFRHPESGKRLEFRAPLPEDFQNLLKTLEKLKPKNKDFPHD